MYPKIWPVLGLWASPANLHKIWGFWGLFGPFQGHMVELEGRQGLIDTRKSSRLWSVPTVSLCLAGLNGF